MRDYSSWKRKRCKVTGLLLDAKNPRIPPARTKLAQSELIAKLVEHDDVYGLAKSIVESGYFPTDPLVAVVEDGEKVVVEGNRRLAALKVLISPEAAPEKHHKKFRALASVVSKDALDQIEVLIAPSRVDATPLILERHTRSHLQRWETAMQANFYQSLIEAGASSEDLQKWYGISHAELSDSLRMHAIYQVACSLDLDEKVREKVQNPHSFPLTNLERLIESTDGREFLRIEADANDVFTVKGRPDSFRNAFAKIVTDVATKKATSRKLNNAAGIRKYLEGIKEYQPSKNEKGSFAIKDLIKPAEEEARPEAPSPTPRTPKQSLSLIPTGIKCTLLSPRIRDLFKEVRKLYIDKFPNSAGVMLRVLLELCTSHRIDRNPDGKAWVEQRRTRDGQGRAEWYPTLKNQLDWLLKNDPLELRGLELRAFRMFAQGDPKWLNLERIDAFLHNRYVAPSPEELRRIALVLDPVWRELLSETPLARGN